MINISLAGLGIMGTSYIDNIIEIPDFTLVGICDKNGSSVQKILQGLKDIQPAAFTNYEEMLKQTKSDLVIVATPTDTHFSFLKQAIEQGSHVLIEKPACLTFEEADQLEKITPNEGQKIAVDYLMRFSPIVDEAKKFIDDYNLQPHHLDIRWIKDRRAGRPHFGVIGQEATHPLDLILHSLLGCEGIKIPNYILTHKGSGGQYETDANFYLKIGDHTIVCDVSFVKTSSKRHISIYCKKPNSHHEYRILLAFDKERDRNISIDRMAIYDTETGKWYNWSEREGFKETTPGNFMEYQVKKLNQQLLAVAKWIETGGYNPRICTLEQAIRDIRLCEEIRKRPQIEFTPFPY